MLRTLAEMLFILATLALCLYLISIGGKGVFEVGYMGRGGHVEGFWAFGYLGAGIACLKVSGHIVDRFTFTR